MEIILEYFFVGLFVLLLVGVGVLCTWAIVDTVKDYKESKRLYE